MFLYVKIKKNKRFYVYKLIIDFEHHIIQTMYYLLYQ